MSLGVYSATTKLLQTWKSEHTHLNNVRGSHWTFHVRWFIGTIFLGKGCLLQYAGDIPVSHSITF